MERVAWLLCSSEPADCARVYQKHIASINSLPVPIKAELCRYLTARAIANGALQTEISLPNVRQGGVQVGVGIANKVCPEASIVANILLATSGLALTDLKRLIDHPGSYSGRSGSSSSASSAIPPAPDVHVDLVTVLSLLPGPIAAHVLHHIHVEAVSVSTRGPAWPWLVKLYSDYDDTVEARVFDHSFPPGTVYPGYVPLVKAMRGELKGAGAGNIIYSGRPAGDQHESTPGDAQPSALSLDPADTTTGVAAPTAVNDDSGSIVQTVVAAARRLSGSSGGSGSTPTHTPAGRSQPGLLSLRSGFGGRQSILVVSDIALSGAAMRTYPGAASREASLAGARSQAAIDSPGAVAENSLGFAAGQATPPRRAYGHAESGAAGSSPARAGPGTTSSLAQDSFVPRGDLVFLSARPAFLRTHTMQAARAAGLGHAAVLCGTIAGGVTHSRLAARKLRNHLLHHALFGEFRVVFIGDTGQADVQFALTMLKAHRIMYGHAAQQEGAQATAEPSAASSSEPRPDPSPLPGADRPDAREDDADVSRDGTEGALELARDIATVTASPIAQRESATGTPERVFSPPAPLVLIHDICGVDQRPLTSALERARLRAAGVHVFDSYLEAGLIAAQAGVIGSAELAQIELHTTQELAQVTFGPVNEAQRVLRLQDFTMAVRRIQHWLTDRPAGIRRRQEEGDG